jgi:hypothetical protein
MNNDPTNMVTPLDEQLVAYLDGELDPESGRRIEELLASDAEVRRRLQALERTWDLLDELDTAPVGGQFTHTTLEMVAVAANRDAEEALAEAPRRRRRRALAVGGGLLGAVAAGFLAVALLTPNRDRQLLQDLPVLEGFDEYRQADSIEFLRLLGKTGLFSREDSESPADTGHIADELIGPRRQRIESMSPSEKEQLQQRQEQFSNLDQDQQRQMRQLHETLQRAPDAQQLRQVMYQYAEWLKTLPWYERMELAAMTPTERIKSIEKWLKEEQARGGSRPGIKDSMVLWRWTNEYATSHEKQILETLPEEQRKRLADSPASMRHRLAFMQMWPLRQATGFGKLPSMMTEDDLARLGSQLTPELRKQLESKPTIEEQWRVVVNWMRHAGPHQVGARTAHSRPAAADDEILVDFFEHGLSDQDRDKLLSLPGDEMQRELQRLFLTTTRPDGQERRHDGPRRGRRVDGGQPASTTPDKHSRAAGEPSPH